MVAAWENRDRCQLGNLGVPRPRIETRRGVAAEKKEEIDVGSGEGHECVNCVAVPVPAQLDIGYLDALHLGKGGFGHGESNIGGRNRPLAHFLPWHSSHGHEKQIEVELLDGSRG